MSVAAKAYTATASSLHWLSGISMVGCIGCVLQVNTNKRFEGNAWFGPSLASLFFWNASLTSFFSIICLLFSFVQAQNSPKGQKGPWMHRHKSLGLLTGILVAPRLAYRVVNRSSVRRKSLDRRGIVSKSTCSAELTQQTIFLSLCFFNAVQAGRACWYKWCGTISRQSQSLQSLCFHDHHAGFRNCHGVLWRKGIAIFLHYPSGHCQDGRQQEKHGNDCQEQFLCAQAARSVREIPDSPPCRSRRRTRRERAHHLCSNQSVCSALELSLFAE